MRAFAGILRTVGSHKADGYLTAAYGIAQETAIGQMGPGGESGIGFQNTQDVVIAVDGIATKTKAGVPTDADFAVMPLDGTLVVDTTDNKLYVRIGGWKSVAVA